MKTQLEKRLTDLRQEFETGQQELDQLQVKTRQLQNTLLRISGAIQVLEEELGKADIPEELDHSSAGNGLTTGKMGK